jgi:hypothetical protein
MELNSGAPEGWAVPDLIILYSEDDDFVKSLTTKLQARSKIMTFEI